MTSPSDNRNDRGARTGRLRVCCIGGLVLVSASVDGQVVTDGSLGAQQNIAGPNYLINPVLGQQRGGNLFHSFTTFSVAASESATFETNVGTANVIARVTGGFGSEINGTLNANANLFLLNPQGILVGPNASINVSGSLHLTSADYIRFGNNQRFYAELSESSSLSMSAPAAFGFLDGAIAPVRVNGTALSLSNGQTLSLVGGEVSLENVDVNVPGGTVNLVAAAGTGEAVLGNGLLDASSIVTRGELRLNDVAINGPAVEAASIFVRSGQFVMENGSSIGGNTAIAASARTLDMEADSLQLRNSRIEYDSSGAMSGTPITTAAIRASQFAASDNSVLSIAGGDLSIIAGDMRVDSGSSVGTATTDGGRAGGLTINADTVRVNGGTLTTIGGDGDAGGIRVSATDLIDIRGGGLITSTTSGAGVGGPVEITARQLVIDGSQSTSITGITADSLSVAPNAGDAGNVAIAADAIQLRNGLVSSTTNGPGRGGDISVSGSTIAMDEGAAITTETGVAGQSGAAVFGRGGDIALDATAIQFSSGARITASTLANGEGGSIRINAAQLQIDSTGAALTGVTANSGSAGVSASGNGGSLYLDVNELQLRNRGQIASNAFGTGQAGRIELSGNSLTIAAGGVISASSFGEGANAGAANDIYIVVQQLDIDDFGQITNSTTGSGDAGQLSIVAERIRIANGGLLQASSLSQNAQAGAVGDILIDSRTLELNGGSINARSFGGAAPGTIEIDVHSLVATNGAVISATSAGAADAGFISIRATDAFRLANFSRVTTEALQGSGGNVRIFAGNRLLLTDSSISTSVLGPAASGGNIDIDTTYAVLSNSQIVARAVGGTGGGIDLESQFLIRDANSVIDASSALGVGGRVGISGLDLELKADFVPLPVEFLSTQEWLATRCGAGSDVNRFTVAGRDGAYRSALDYLQGPLLLAVPTVPTSTSNAETEALAVLTTSLSTFDPLCLGSR